MPPVCPGLSPGAPAEADSPPPSGWLPGCTPQKGSLASAALQSPQCPAQAGTHFLHFSANTNGWLCGESGVKDQNFALATNRSWFSAGGGGGNMK